MVKDPAAPYAPQMDGIAVLTKNTQLLDAMQKALQALIDDGTYQKISPRGASSRSQSATVNAGPSYAASHASPAKPLAVIE